MPVKFREKKICVRIFSALAVVVFAIRDLTAPHRLVSSQENYHSVINHNISVESWGDGRWDRFLIGIFSYDHPNEYDLRVANRDTHLNYFQQQHSAINDNRAFTICSLQEVLKNASLFEDRSRCRILYTFVMGGGIRDDNLRNKMGRGLNMTLVNNTILTRCLWQDPICGGEDILQWTLKNPKFNTSSQLDDEIQKNQDITFLSISENHELGKTDTWFTYAAMLTKIRPDLNIRFISKLDSDNFISYDRFEKFLGNAKEQIKSEKYIYGGSVVYKEVCSGRAYGYLCKDPQVIARLFMPGAFVYLSVPLAQHVFMNGTTLGRKKEVWVPREDVQLGNMVYSSDDIAVGVLNHNKFRGISRHFFNNATSYREDYIRLYPPSN